MVMGVSGCGCRNNLVECAMLEEDVLREEGCGFMEGVADLRVLYSVQEPHAVLLS